MWTKKIGGCLIEGEKLRRAAGEREGRDEEKESGNDERSISKHDETEFVRNRRWIILDIFDYRIKIKSVDLN